MKQDKKNKELWEFQMDDLDPSDSLYKISRPYRIWHEYLRVSPIFKLAIRSWYQDIPKKGQTKSIYTDEEQSRIPEDFGEIMTTYYRMFKSEGFTINTTYFEWWIEHGTQIFGYRYSPSPIILKKVSHGDRLYASEILNSLEEYSLIRRENGRTGFALISVPLTGKKKDVLASINDLFVNSDFTPIKTSKSLYTLEKGKQLDKLNIGLRVLWIAALNPHLELWRIGLLANITDNDEYTTLDINLSKHNDITKYKTEYLASMTSRKLNEAIIIMENAARGRFPCNNARLVPKFNKKEILELVRESIIERYKIEEKRYTNLRKQSKEIEIDAYHHNLHKYGQQWKSL